MDMNVDFCACCVVFWVVYVIIIHHHFIVNNCMKVATVMHGTEIYILSSQSQLPVRDQTRVRTFNSNRSA